MYTKSAAGEDTTGTAAVLIAGKAQGGWLHAGYKGEKELMALLLLALL